MAKFVQLTNPIGGKIFINPEHVAALFPAFDDDEKTLVLMDAPTEGVVSGHVFVKGAPAQIAAWLEGRPYDLSATTD